MKIISKRGEKDYYDYIASIMGIDEKVVYDRRNSTVMGESEYHIFEYPFGYDLYFSKKPFKNDGPKIKKSKWASCKYKNRKGRYGWSWKSKDKYEYEGSIYNLYLEVGRHVFILEVERYLDDDGKLVINSYIADSKEIKNSEKKSTAPLYICKYYIEYRRVNSTDGVENPILKDTWIPGLIPAHDMWNMLYEYISSLNDKEFTDSRTNEQHIESAGFDKKISFRHRK
jgi:hypothetical protein